MKYLMNSNGPLGAHGDVGRPFSPAAKITSDPGIRAQGSRTQVGGVGRSMQGLGKALLKATVRDWRVALNPAKMQQTFDRVKERMVEKKLLSFETLKLGKVGAIKSSMTKKERKARKIFDS